MSDEKLNSEAIRLISRLWRGGTIATINRKSKSGAVNLSKWIKPDELNRVPISDLANVYVSTATATQIPPTNAKGEIVENQYKEVKAGNNPFMKSKKKSTRRKSSSSDSDSDSGSSAKKQDWRRQRR